MTMEESGKAEKWIMGYVKGRGLLRPLNTGWLNQRIACLRTGGVNLYCYRKHGTAILIDAGASEDRLAEKLDWLGLRPEKISHVLLTHLDPGQIAGVAAGCRGLFSHCRLYLGQVENKYLTGEKNREILKGFCKLPVPALSGASTLLSDDQTFWINDIKVDVLLVRGHSWGHLCYLIDDEYLFSGDAIWLGPEGGYSPINFLSEDNHLARCSLRVLKARLEQRDIPPVVLTAHTGWTADLEFAFRHTDRSCNGLKRCRLWEKASPYDPFDDREDRQEQVKNQPQLPNKEWENGGIVQI